MSTENSNENDKNTINPAKPRSIFTWIKRNWLITLLLPIAADRLFTLLSQAAADFLSKLPGLVVDSSYRLAVDISYGSIHTENYLTSLATLFYLCLMTMTIIDVLRSHINRVIDKKESESKFPIKISRIKYNISIFSCLFFIFSMITYNAAKFTLASAANVTYQRRVDVLDAVISNAESKQIRARWAVISSREGFNQLEVLMSDLARDHGMELPPFRY